ncbi:MAG TPA: response regulator [Polyangiaceae bacterium]
MTRARATSSIPPPMSVLVADDDASARRAIHILLESEGYEVTETSDGDTTLELLVDAVMDGIPLPDVLLLDFKLPGYSGLGVLRALRRVSPIPPTVLITGFPDHSVEVLARNLGVLRVLYKPLDADDLLAAVLEAARVRSHLT